MRKLIAATALAVTVIGAGGTAFAGEVTGGPNPKPTPIKDHTASSICSFSGQNDDPTGTDPETGEVHPTEVGRVQSWGQTRNLIIALEDPDGHGASGLNDLLRSFGPGVSCRGGGGGEP
jgi:hypothetical protein